MPMKLTPRRVAATILVLCGAALLGPGILARSVELSIAGFACWFAALLAPGLSSSELGGGSVDVLLQHKDDVDRCILGQLQRQRPLPIKASGMTDSATVFLRMRGIYWAARTGRPPPCWSFSH